jgi:hypothetical protein
MTNDLIQVIKEHFALHGYQFFEKGEYNLNIFSIRSKNGRVNKFDDLIYCAYIDKYGHWRLHQWACTTDPGTFWLKNPSRVEGTAILAPGQYRGVYKIDKHGGKYEALCQRLGDVKVYRDGNKDNIIDISSDSVMNGVFGINIHKSGSDSENVDKWSAGCTVFKRSVDFDIFMSICRESEKIWGNKFSYTLFSE